MSRDAIVYLSAFGVLLAAAGLIFVAVLNLGVFLWIICGAVAVFVLFMIFGVICVALDEMIPDDVGKPKPDKEDTDF